MHNINDIKNEFQREFDQIANKFEIIELQADKALRADESLELDAKYVSHPGVYVWWSSEKGPLRVGRSLTNSRKRALEHIRDNTGKIMAQMANNPDTVLLLFNVKDPSDRHWVAAVEIFLEEKIKPLIKSLRKG